MKMNTAELSAVSAARSPEVEGKSPEEMIAHFARVSNPGNQHNDKTAPKLLLYLITNSHWSPFAMITLTVKVQTTRAIMQQLLRHWTMDFQEFSQRYATVEDIDFSGVEARMKHVGGNRQGSGEPNDEWTVHLHDSCAQSAAIYQSAIEGGVAPECARMVLPGGTPTTAYVTTNVRTAITYFWQRLCPHAQSEHRELAWAIYDEFKKAFPLLADIVLNYRPVVLPQRWAAARPGEEQPEQPELFPQKYPQGLPKFHDGEPWFLLRSQDSAAPEAVLRYAELMKGLGLMKNEEEVRAFHAAMIEWQDANAEKVKQPD